MKSTTLTTLIARSFAGVGMSVNNLHTDSDDTDKRPYSPMRNNKGGFDVSICVTCFGGSFEYQDNNVSVNKADISVLVALDNCSYSHDKGFQWEEGTGTYRILDLDMTPSITLYKDSKPLDSGNKSVNDVGLLSKDEDKALSVTVIKELLTNSTHDDMMSVFKSVVNKDSAYKVKA